MASRTNGRAWRFSPWVHWGTIDLRKRQGLGTRSGKTIKVIFLGVR
jgi:hypothetical protein